MTDNAAVSAIRADIPAEIFSNPALLFLYYRIEQILGIKAGSEALIRLNEYLEKNCGSSFTENPSAYGHLLDTREQIHDISKFLTVNETYFFREGVHFELLASLLPELAKLERPVQICSAAVSIGCEAYSIAMLLDHHIKKGLNLDFVIDAFDVSAEAIEAAKNARYTANTLRGDGAAYKYILDSYLIADNGEYIVSQNIRKKVNFFPYNIMRGLDKQYDVIFFRNSLIYFSSKSRPFVVNNLAESLFSGGFLFIGISETASIKHPLLANRYSQDAFYFQKPAPAYFPEQHDLKQNHIPREKTTHTHAARQVHPKYSELPVNCAEIADLLKVQEGKLNAQNVLDKLADQKTDSLSGSRLAASAAYYLQIQDFVNADLVLTHLEKHNTGTFTKFLRGEYFFLRGNAEDAEKNYQEAAVKDKFFWPAFYRIAVLSADGNLTRYEYKIKKTIESIELSQSLDGKELNYECFMGGFSPDYFRRILEKKLTEKQEASYEYQEL